MKKMANDVSDEDDYMSDKLLANIKSGDVRPGLIHQRSTKVKYENQLKHKLTNEKSRIKPKKVLEAEHREAALTTALGSENKGFAMLQKMGYKAGSSLGKQGTGRMEPIPVVVKMGRSGLGQDTALKRKQDEKLKMQFANKQKRMKLEARKNEDFVVNQRRKMAERQTQADLYNSQKACEQLDSKKGLEMPVEKWFWPDRMKQTCESSSDESDSEDNSEDEIKPEERLEVLTGYLRREHKFCVWCGIQYDGDEDLQSNCPGNTADVH